MKAMRWSNDTAEEKMNTWANSTLPTPSNAIEADMWKTLQQSAIRYLQTVTTVLIEN